MADKKDFVKMQKCMHCGENTDTILMARNPNRGIKEGEEYSGFCAKCEKLFRYHHFFITKKCNCSGFIKKSALKKALTAEGYKKYKNNKIIGFNTCPNCGK